MQIDSRLEFFLETTSYFLDSYQDILEVLTGRMVWTEANKESPVELLAKDQQSLKQEYDLLELQLMLQKNSRKL